MTTTQSNNIQHNNGLMTMKNGAPAISHPSVDTKRAFTCLADLSPWSSESPLPREITNVPSELLEKYPHTKRVGNYLLGKTLGEGSFAKVREGLHTVTGEKVRNCLNSHRNWNSVINLFILMLEASQANVIL